jgi:hypothetical protein
MEKSRGQKSRATVPLMCTDETKKFEKNVKIFSLNRTSFPHLIFALVPISTHPTAPENRHTVLLISYQKGTFLKHILLLIYDFLMPRRI